jgi:tetratricopeptide (TPR) repeat protein
MQGDYAAAAEYLRKCIDLYGGAPASEEHRVARLEVQSHLGWCLTDKDQAEEAKALFQNVLREYRALGHSRDHKGVMLAQAGLFSILLTESSEVEAIRILNGELAESERLDVRIFAEYGAALMARRLRSFEGARGLYERVRGKVIEQLGPKHFLLGMLLIDYAGLLQESGNYEQSERVFNEALDILLPALGAHPKLIQPVMRYGDILSSLGRNAEAARAAELAASMLERTQPQNTNLWLTCQQQRARCLRLAGKQWEAITLLEGSLNRVDPADRAVSISREMRMALLRSHYEVGNCQIARELAQLDQASSATDSDRANYVTMLIDIAASEGNESVLASTLHELHELLDIKRADRWPYGAPLRGWEKVSDSETIIDHYRREMTAEQKFLGCADDHPALLDRARKIAHALAISGRSAESLMAWDEVIKGYCRVLGDEHRIVARFRTYRAAVRSAYSAEQSEVIAELLTVRETLEQVSDANPLWVADVDRGLATALQKAQRLPDAADRARRARETYRQVLPQMHPRCHVVELEYIRLLQAQGEWDAAARAAEDWLKVLQKGLPAQSLRIAEVEQLWSLSQAKLSGLDAQGDTEASQRLKRCAELLGNYQLWADDFLDF